MVCVCLQFNKTLKKKRIVRTGIIFYQMQIVSSRKSITLNKPKSGSLEFLLEPNISSNILIRFPLMLSKKQSVYTFNSALFFSSRPFLSSTCASPHRGLVRVQQGCILNLYTVALVCITGRSRGNQPVRNRLCSAVMQKKKIHVYPKLAPTSANSNLLI